MDERNERNERKVKGGLRRISPRRRRFKKYLRTCLGGLFVCAFISILLAPQIFLVIKAGHAGVLFRPLRQGTVTEKVFTEGFYFLFPWNSMHLYDVRTHEITHKVVALDSHGLSIEIEVSARFHPQLQFLGHLHKEIGPDYAEKIVRPQLSSAIREVIGHHRAEDLYYKKRGHIQRQILGEAYLLVGTHFVFLEDVLLKSIILPPKIVSAIESKLKQQQIYQEYGFRIEREKQEAQRLKIQAEGIDIYQRTLTAHLNPELLEWKSIEATEELYKTGNEKILMIGPRNGNPPVIVNWKENRTERGTDKEMKAKAKANQ